MNEITIQYIDICVFFFFTFRYTVVLNYEHFWVNEETDTVPVVQLSPEEYELKSSINHEYYVYKLYVKNCFV